MSKALAVLKLFFSLVSINSTETPSSANSSSIGVPSSARAPTSLISPTSLNATANVGQAPTTHTPQTSLKLGVVYVGQAFRIPIPFSNRDKTKLRFAMKTVNNIDISPLSWIQFDSNKREVYGFPLPGNVFTFVYKVTVSNSEALLQEIVFELSVRANGFKYHNHHTNEYSHEMILKTGKQFRYHQFMTRVNTRIDFVSKMARYCFNEKPTSIWIKTFSKEPRELTIVFVNIPYSPCIESTYSKLKSSLVDKNSTIQPQFQKALTERFPVESAEFKFFGACDPNMLGPEPSFEWGWLKHVIPVAMILAVVGVPVTLSCVVNRRMRRRKRPVEEGRPRRTLRRRNEDGTDLTSHTVHFNNRYPSMLSVSREETIGGDEKGHNEKSNIPNGNLAGGHSTAQNATSNQPKPQGDSTVKTTKNKKNPFKFASDEERKKFDVRAMWDDDEEEEQTPVNIPTYYTYKNSDKEDISMMDAVLDMNFSGIAENISTKLKDVKSSILNVQGEAAAQETNAPQPSNSGPSLSTKLKGLGKSMLNVSMTSNEPPMAARRPSVSNKLRDFGKSLLNVSTGAEGAKEDSLKNGSELQKDAYQDSRESFLFYNLREYDDARNERRDYDDVRRSNDDTGQVYDDARRRYENAQRGYDDAWDGYGDTRQGYNDTLRGFDDVRQGYGDARRGYDDPRQTYDLTEDRFFRHLNRRHSNTSGTTSEFELAQYNFHARQHSSSSNHQHRTQDRYDSYRRTPMFESRRARKSSRENDFDEYPASLFDALSEHSLTSEQEKSIFDADYYDTEGHTPFVAKPTPVWKHSPVNKAPDGLGLNDVTYRDYTNPYGYSNDPTRVSTRLPRGKTSRSFSSQSRLDFWDDEEFGQGTGWKQSSDTKGNIFASFANSVPDVRRGNIPNGTKPQRYGTQKQGKSLLTNAGLLLSGEKPPVVFTLGDSDEEEHQQKAKQQQQQQQQQPERKSSFVGLIKTGVSSMLEPDVSKWLSGFQQSDNPVT